MRYRKEPEVRRVETEGRTLALVPLYGERDRCAVLDAADFDRLAAAGVPAHWWIDRRGTRYEAPCVSIAGRPVGVARLILECGPGEGVHYVTRDRLNLCRENIRRVRMRRAFRDHGARAVSEAQAAMRERVASCQPRARLEAELRRIADETGIAIIPTADAQRGMEQGKSHGTA